MRTMLQLTLGTSCKRRHREQSCYLTDLVPETYQLTATLVKLWRVKRASRIYVDEC